MKVSFNILWTAAIVVPSLFDFSTCFVVPSRTGTWSPPPQQQQLVASASMDDLLDLIKAQDDRIKAQDDRIKTLEKDNEENKARSEAQEKINEENKARWSRVDKGFATRAIVSKQEKMLMSKVVGYGKVGVSGFLNQYWQKIDNEKFDDAEIMLKKWNNAMPDEQWTIDKIEDLAEIINAKKDMGNWFAHNAQPSDSFSKSDFE